MENVACSSGSSHQLVERFRSFAEWRTWADAHREIFSVNEAERLISEIRTNGVLEPLTGRLYPTEQVLIGHDNYRETIKADLLISRHRGLLFELQFLAVNGRSQLASRQCRIYAPEAVTDFALYLRGKYPYFLGSEYAETEEAKQTIYPIQTEDLTNLSLRSNAFDLVISSDVFEHIPDLDRCLSEVSRVLMPHGVLLSTFPFCFSREGGIVKARFKDDQIEFLSPPEYHGNPMKPLTGSLVFELPGWDIVSRARAAGFEDAYFAFISSARHGILGKGINGVFVFVALKRMSERMSVVDNTNACFSVYRSEKPRFDTVAGLIGLPRSGTTVLAAAVGAHPSIKALYEPWNANRGASKSDVLSITGILLHPEVAFTYKRRAMSGRNVILHYHIFKNAGTSFNKALEIAFGDSYMEFDGEQASNAFEPQQIAKIIQENPTKRAFSTHQGMLPLPQMDDGEVFGTLLLRHPLARISSIYHFERKQDSQSLGAMKAKELSFGDYLRWRWEQSPAFFCFQALFCARTVEHREYKPLETILQRARKNLEQVHCVGTVENYPQFLVHAQSLLLIGHRFLTLRD